MANDATSNAQAGMGIRRGYSGGTGGGYSGPRSSFDANTPAGVDPEGLWRFSNTDKYRRTGATTAERAGAVPGYTPGYGRSSNRNAGGSMGGGAGSLTPQAQWDAQFQPHLAAQMQPQLGPAMETARHGTAMNQQSGMDVGAALIGAASPTAPPPAASPVLPPAATPEPASPGLPVLPPSPGIQQQGGGMTFDPSTGIRQAVGAQGSVYRAIPGLPQGQSASATFVPGQNSPQNLAKRTRPPVDPLAT